MSPLYLADVFSCRQTPLVEFCEGSGVAGSPGVSTPGDLPPISFSDCVHRPLWSDFTHTSSRVLNNNNRLRQVGDPLFFTHVAHFMVESSWKPVMSAAQRRRQRRLRSWWRHEQQSIAAALATSQHQLSPTETEEGQGRGGGFRVELCGEDPEASPSPCGRHHVLSDGRG